MKPLQHARITAHRYGGQWQDWIAFHDWIDRSKLIFPRMQHRMFLHSDFGEWLAVKVHGASLTATGGMAVSTADLFRDHQMEDLGRVVSLSEWLRAVEAIGADVATGLAARWGGVPADYAAALG